MRGEPSRPESGFTLIELLLVVVIIGILASIAIPTFLNQRTKAYRSQALSDMKNAALALETYATENNGSYAGLNGVDEDSPLLSAEGFRHTEWVSLQVNSDAMSYCLVGVNEKVPGKQFVLRSDNGTVRVELEGTPAC